MTTISATPSTAVSTMRSATPSTADLWSSAWTQLRAAYPDVESRLAQLERERPTRARALQRMEASAGRASGRCQRGTPRDLLKKLLVWQQAILVELDQRKDPHA